MRWTHFIVHEISPISLRYSAAAATAKKQLKRVNEGRRRRREIARYSRDDGSLALLLER